jgi:hypothetical protein
MTTPANSAAPSRLGILPRVLMLTFGLTGISFAVTLFFSILGMVAWGFAHGHLPDMRMAYRQFAFPVAVVVAVFAFAGAWVTEIRYYRRAKALAANDSGSRF